MLAGAPQAALYKKSNKTAWPNSTDMTRQYKSNAEYQWMQTVSSSIKRVSSVLNVWKAYLCRFEWNGQQVIDKWINGMHGLQYIYDWWRTINLVWLEKVSTQRRLPSRYTPTQICPAPAIACAIMQSLAAKDVLKPSLLRATAHHCIAPMQSTWILKSHNAKPFMAGS